MSIKKWAIGALSDEKAVDEMIKLWLGLQYNHAYFNTYHHEAIETVKRLAAADDALRRRFLAECFRAAKEKGAEMGSDWPNKKQMESRTVEVPEKYGLFDKKTRIVKKKVMDPNYCELTKLLCGEEYVFLHSDRSEEEDRVKDEECDTVLLLTESGRFITFMQSFTIYFSPTPPHAWFGTPSALTRGSPLQYCMAAEYYAGKLGEAGLESAWRKISATPAPVKTTTPAKTTAPAKTPAPAKTSAPATKAAGTQETAAAKTTTSGLTPVFSFRVDGETFFKRSKRCYIYGKVLSGNARANDRVQLGNELYRIQTIERGKKEGGYDLLDEAGKGMYVDLLIHDERLDVVGGTVVTGFRKN